MTEKKNQEAVAEAVLFTMGQSVELNQIAAALETDRETAREAVDGLRNGIRKRKTGDSDY